MSVQITYKHSFNSGDLITLLPAIKNLYQKTGRKALIYQRLNLPADYSHNDNHPVTHDGRKVCMTFEMFKKLRPLIIDQEYVEDFRVWAGAKVLFDLDLTRMDSTMPLPGGDIHYWPTLIFPQLEPLVNDPWLSVEKNTEWKERIIINRTERYQNPYIDFYFLKEHLNSLSFVGTEREHQLFCDQFGLYIPHHSFDSFKELASAINGCKLFIGNQSMCWHIADALKVNRILEVCHLFPNTFPTGENGKAFIKQGSFELYFNQFIKNESITNNYNDRG